MEEAEGREFRPVIRIAGTDIDGTKRLMYGLLRIKGVGFMFANAVARAAGLDPYMRCGYLTDEEIKKIEDVLANPAEYGIPGWLFNRRKDLKTGKDLHLIGTDVTLAQKEDIKRLKRIKCWRGIRHALGLKVRGQKTRTTGRKGLTVGVVKRRT